MNMLDKNVGLKFLNLTEMSSCLGRYNTLTAKNRQTVKGSLTHNETWS